MMKHESIPFLLAHFLSHKISGCPDNFLQFIEAETLADTFNYLKLE